MNRLFKLLCLAFVIACTGCANVAPPYSPDYVAVDALKRAKLEKASVGKAQPTDAKAKVNAISLRTSSLTAGDISFAEYLERAMASDLREAGLFEAGSARRIDMVLLKNVIDVSGFSEGVGTMEIELSVVKLDQVLLKKKYAVETKFESSFIGGIAIPNGVRAYPNLVRALLSTVYRDPEFVQALKAP